MSEDTPSASIEIRIEEGPARGEYTLHLNNVAVVRIGDTYATKGCRQCHWMIYGPTDVEWSIALMKGFLQLTAVLANERASDRPPTQEPVTERAPRRRRKTR
jgi:hypothetical protein